MVVAAKPKGQPSRKGKKAWRKNVDLMDIDDALIEQNNELIIGGYDTYDTALCLINLSLSVANCMNNLMKHYL